MQKSEKSFKRGEIYFCDFGNGEGSVQGGKRPVFILQEEGFNHKAPTIIVAAITTVIKKTYLKSHVFRSLNGCFYAKLRAIETDSLIFLQKNTLQEAHMDKFDPKNIDSRPKRRRDKDNPYRLFTVGIDTGSPHFYVEFVDSQGIKICTEVGRSVWELLDRFELDDKKHMNEVERHHDENHDAFFLLSEDNDMADEVIRKIVYEMLYWAIDELPEKQRRRIIMYYFYGLTYEQIAEIEGCKHSSVIISVQSAIKKLKKLLQTLYNLPF